jgi:hypothetical protein
MQELITEIKQVYQAIYGDVSKVYIYPSSTIKVLQLAEKVQSNTNFYYVLGWGQSRGIVNHLLDHMNWIHKALEYPFWNITNSKHKEVVKQIQTLLDHIQTWCNQYEGVRQ